MICYGVSDSRVYVFGSNIMQTHVPEGQPRGCNSGHAFCRCPSWLVGKELELSVPLDQVLGLEFFHKLNRIVVCDNLFFMRAKILRQNMQQTVLGLLKSQRRASAPVPQLDHPFPAARGGSNIARPPAATLATGDSPEFIQ